MMCPTPVTSIVLVGVGGQGILLASDIMAHAAVHAGYQVKTNEVHGMAQRGGSVIAQIRYGRAVHSPLVEEGTARVLGALEASEAIRFAHYLATDGEAIVSTQTIIPVTVSSGQATYPAQMDDTLRQVFSRVRYLDVVAVAERLGNARAANTVLLGALSQSLDLPLDAWHAALAACVPEKHRQLNLHAFMAGRNDA
ncbi:MAG TPA: indolepyruvate oxidoreductase subunit beta [Armatimonadota bacterium]|jgi:indolepyruvate ferredoxin oxidoreductase beta subunit